MKQLLLVLMAFLLHFHSFSQVETIVIDSLSARYYASDSDSNRVKTAIDLTYEYLFLNIDSAIKYANDAVDLAQTIENDRLLLNSMWAQARAISERDIPKSMKIFYQILEMNRRLGDKAGIAICYHNIGLLHLYTGSTERYIYYLRKAKAIHEEVGNAEEVNNIYAEIGGIYSTEDRDSARYYLNLAGLDSTHRNAEYHQYYWAVTEQIDNPAKAGVHFLKSLEISKDRNNLRCYSLASRWFCIFLQNQNQIDSAIAVAKTGLSAANELGFLRGVVNNSEQLHKIYDRLNKTDSAYKYLSLNVSAQNTLLSQDKIDRIQQSVIREQQRSQELQLEKEHFEARIKLFGAGGVAFVLLLFALFFYRNQLKTRKSNDQLRKQAEEINSKNKELQTSYENLKSAQAQLIQSEKMASLGELTAGIAHEIQNPLNFVNNFSEVSGELIDEVISDMAVVKTRFTASPGSPTSQDNQDILSATSATLDDIKQNLEKITHHGKRADAIVKGMLAHSRSNSGEKVPTDINALAEEYLKFSYHGFSAKDKNFNADYKTDFDPELPEINVVPQDIGRVLLNLINNAFQAAAMHTGHAPSARQPLITVSTKIRGDKIEISVKDNGPGIPDSIKDKIFQPFFTTKPTGQGTGLGLSLSYDIVKAHGGSIKIKSKEYQGVPTERAGAEFIIQLPR